MNFHPLFLSPLLSFFSYPSNIEIVFDFSGIITKIHPPFQNPRSAPGGSEVIQPITCFKSFGTVSDSVECLRKGHCTPRFYRTLYETSFSTAETR